MGVRRSWLTAASMPVRSATMRAMRACMLLKPRAKMAISAGPSSDNARGLRREAASRAKPSTASATRPSGATIPRTAQTTKSVVERATKVSVPKATSDGSGLRRRDAPGMALSTVPSASDRDCRSGGTVAPLGSSRSSRSGSTTATARSTASRSATGAAATSSAAWSRRVTAPGWRARNQPVRFSRNAPLMQTWKMIADRATSRMSCVAMRPGRTRRSITAEPRRPARRCSRRSAPSARNRARAGWSRS